MYTVNRFLLLFLSFSLFLSPLTAATEDRGGRVTSQLPAWDASLKERAERVFSRPTMLAMLKNIAWFGGPLALMMYANKKIKDHHKARDIKLRQQQGLAAQQQQMMAQLMMALQQGQGGGEMGGMGMPMPGGPMDHSDMREPLDDEFVADEVRQPALPASGRGEQGPQGPQAQASDAAEEIPAGVAQEPEAMMPMGMQGLPQMPQIKQPSYNPRHILSKKAYWFWQVTSWVCASLTLYNGAGLAFNTFALARSVIKDDKMPNKPAALAKVEAKAEYDLTELAHLKLPDDPDDAATEIRLWRALKKREVTSRSAGGDDAKERAQKSTVAGINEEVQNAREYVVSCFEHSALPRIEDNIFGHSLLSRFKMFMQGIKEPQADS